MVTAPHSIPVQVALIGSFRQHFATVLDARSCCDERGLIVNTPLGSEPLDANVDFVRLDTDTVTLSDPEVQSVAMDRILRAAAVFTVAPGGYVGRTTCYEIGRVLQSGVPLYFSEAPLDLPISVPSTHILTVSAFAALVASGGHSAWTPDQSTDPSTASVPTEVR
jgi:hypothetical protein